mgnify:CR=1 FL=1
MQEALLMVKIQPPTRNYPIWMPPGGRLHYGESLQDGVRREFLEETQLEVQVEHLVFVHQFLEAPFHALEFYFYCTGIDDLRVPQIVEPPENAEGEAVLLDVDFIPMAELEGLDIEPRHLMEFSPEQIVTPQSENLTLYSTF